MRNQPFPPLRESFTSSSLEPRLRWFQVMASAGLYACSPKGTGYLARFHVLSLEPGRLRVSQARL